MKILKGHVSPETALLVKDYPYSFHLRCQIRYWIEYKPGHGFRLVSQTTNPRKGNIWNKPKASTYSRYGGCMVLDEKEHVTWTGLSEYGSADEAQKWLDTYGDGVPEEGKKSAETWVKMKRAYEELRAKQRGAGDTVVTIVTGEFLP